MYVVIAHYLDLGTTEVLGIARTVEEVEALTDTCPAFGVTDKPWTSLVCYGPFEPGEIRTPGT